MFAGKTLSVVDWRSHLFLIQVTPSMVVPPLLLNPPVTSDGPKASPHHATFLVSKSIEMDIYGDFYGEYPIWQGSISPYFWWFNIHRITMAKPAARFAEALWCLELFVALRPQRCSKCCKRACRVSTPRRRSVLKSNVNSRNTSLLQENKGGFALQMNMFK